MTSDQSLDRSEGESFRAEWRDEKWGFRNKFMEKKDDLNLPIIKGPMMAPKTLSMDGYLEFVEFNLKHNFDREAYKKEKKLLAVNAPFRIK